MNNDGTKKSIKAKTITDILQWVLIVVLIGLTFYYKNISFNLKKDIVEITDNNSTIITYQASQISKLKDVNSELYDKYKNDKQVEYIIQYKYIYKENITLEDATSVVEEQSTDSIKQDGTVKTDSIQKWLYKDKTDILDYEIGVYTEEKPDSVNFKFELNDTVTIVNKKLYNNMYQTYINSSSENQNPIEPIVVFRKKDKFWDNFYYGPSIGGGYGLLNKKLDIYLGFSIGYNLNK
jgi:hypothetical protein